MGTHYTSYCEKCKLAIEDGKDASGLRHELFKLYHNYRYKDHLVERYTDDQWIDKWLNDEKNEPQELYDEKLGFLVRIPEWLEKIVDKEINRWVTNYYKVDIEKNSTEEDVIRKVVELNQDRLLTECLNDYEYRLKRIFTMNKQYEKLGYKHIEILPDQTIVVLTSHGEFYIRDFTEFITLYTVRDFKRIWIANLEDDRVLKYGTENEPCEAD